jgi:hypothetical protein
VEPNADNTLLLYDNPDLGVQFMYPRRWHVAGVHGNQVALDEARGNGLLLTLEPVRQVPTAGEFLNESRTWLAKQKARIRRIETPRRLQTSPTVVDQFALEADVMGQRVVMDYYVLRDASGGATLAARLLPADVAGIRKEMELIARSVRVTRVIQASPPR